MKLLIVEDEVKTANFLRRGFGEEGFVVSVAPNGSEAVRQIESGAFDLIVLDIMLAGMDGWQILSWLRATGRQTPVLILTARDERESIVALLNDGADDYVTKPFDLGELIARAKALIRRGKGQAAAVLRAGDLELDSARRQVRRAGRELALTPMEYRVLEYLVHRQGAVVSKTELLEHLYDYNWEKFSNVIEVYISGLRRKIDEGSADRLIHTLRGHGYVLRQESSVKIPAEAETRR